MERKQSVRLLYLKESSTTVSSSQSPSIPNDSLPPSPKQKRKKTHSEINHTYRQKRLADPERGAIYRETCRLNNKKYKDSAGEEKNKLIRLRMQKLRLNKKAKTISKPRTGNEEKQKKHATEKATLTKRATKFKTTATSTSPTAQLPSESSPSTFSSTTSPSDFFSELTESTSCAQHPDPTQPSPAPRQA
jgi:hypothetical protein